MSQMKDPGARIPRCYDSCRPSSPESILQRCEASEGKQSTLGSLEHWVDHETFSLRDDVIDLKKRIQFRTGEISSRGMEPWQTSHHREPGDRAKGKQLSRPAGLEFL